MQDRFSPRICLIPLVIFTAVLSGCRQSAGSTSLPLTSSPSSPTSAPTEEPRSFPVPEDYRCDQDLNFEWPVIDAVLPSPAEAGSQIAIDGHGGAIRCGNAYDESSRDFDVYIEGEVIGTVNCYVNHCQGDLDVPVDLEPGTYSLSIGPDYEYAFDVQ